MNPNEIIADINTLTPFPETTYQLAALVSDDSRSLSEIIDVIKTDANLVTNVLRLANSAYYGLRQEVQSIDRAVAVLGGQRILEMALLATTASTFEAPQEGYALKKGELWRHSIISATFARKIAVQNGLKSADLIYTAALIKDIGKVILNRYMGRTAKAIDLLANQHHFAFYTAEKKVLGIDHAELGAIAFEKWNFPEKLVFIVRNHHLQKTPVVAPRETCAVFLGDNLASMLGIGTGKDGLIYPFQEELLSRYFDLQSPDRLVFSLFSEVKEISNLINLI
jgi:putative nucleotidyltransferase with HDIG domain